MKKIYFISGLAADEKVFTDYHFDGYENVYIQWLIPSIDESLSDYAHTLSQKIIDKKPVIIGLSFGGIIAQEIKKILPTASIILISSLKHHSHLHWCAKAIKYIPILPLIPNRLFLRPNFIWHFMFGIKTENAKQIFNAMLQSSDIRLVQWSIQQLLHWRQSYEDEKIISIHGTSDRLLPWKKSQVNHSIKNAGHFMVVENADQIMTIINDILHIL